MNSAKEELLSKTSFENIWNIKFTACFHLYLKSKNEKQQERHYLFEHAISLIYLFLFELGQTTNGQTLLKSPFHSTIVHQENKK